ncbi:DNA mismatch endonuclease Vsr [Thalassospira tepidiphila]|jgi:DNA mismatch endonuclease, patch repair protein|uniref:very short patch repair endonuclease n=1 Tax=Thalassospira tepidiphila TaxID=393657 RepID=UPI001BCF74B0|nr:DNA mismatch endonuclease Vsr [Thalassospira tepidiphila]MBS8275695.1 DNA mismatch endonuclease Vsr [Thalassospira tepidiphila]
MTDVVSQAKRSEMMSGIRATDTKPEMMLRKALHARGFRYRLYDKRLPGKPDIVLPKYNAVIFVHGCFWHGHDCHLFKMPQTRTEFWREKIEGNRTRDARNRKLLLDAGWRVADVWECAVKGKLRLVNSEVLVRLVSWINGENPEMEVRGK